MRFEYSARVGDLSIKISGKTATPQYASDLEKAKGFFGGVYVEVTSACCQTWVVPDLAMLKNLKDSVFERPIPLEQMIIYEAFESILTRTEGLPVHLTMGEVYQFRGGI